MSDDDTATVEVVAEAEPFAQVLAVPERVESDEVQVMRELWVLAEQVAHTEFVPKALRDSPEKVLASFLTGREIGLGPMSSTRHVTIIDGTPNVSAEAKLALIRRAGHKVTGSADNQHAEILGVRSDTGDRLTVTYTIEDALQAGSIQSITEDRRVVARSKQNRPMPWEQHTARMLWHAAIRELATRLFSDVTMGWADRVGEPVEDIDTQGDDW